MDPLGSGVTGGGGGQSAPQRLLTGAECPPPETFDREIFADISGKRGKEKKGKGVKMRRKCGKLEMEAGKC